MHIISRSEAKLAGLKRYYTGEKCKHGHLAERLTSTATCSTCKAIQEKVRYESGPGAEYRRLRYESNRLQFIADQKCYDDTRRPEKIQYNRLWRLNNIQYAENYRRTNASLYAFHAAKRRCRLAQATPPWAEWDKIRHLYKQASERGLVVDHIIPIAHPLVCGLHCIDNLQLLTAEENGHKHNTFTAG